MKTSLNFKDADTFYEQLLDAHAGLSPERSEQLNARLILLLANQIGDAQVLRECIEAAASSGEPARDDVPGGLRPHTLPT